MSASDLARHAAAADAPHLPRDLLFPHEDCANEARRSDWPGVEGLGLTLGWYYFTVPERRGFP